MQEHYTTKISANSVKMGHIILFRNDLCIVSKNPEHVKPGKGPAYMQIELKSLKRGTKYNERFSSTESLEKAFLTQRQFKYEYWAGTDAVFLDLQTYEFVSIPDEVIGDKKIFLNDGVLELNGDIIITADLYGEQILNIHLPKTIILIVNEVPPSIKGSTATPASKRATLSNNLEILVPSYVNTGEKIAIKTEDHSFVERVQ